MLNFLVVEDNVIQCKQLINYISEEIPDIRLYFRSRYYKKNNK